MNNLSTIALFQMEISEPVTGSANFPTIRIARISNFQFLLQVCYEEYWIWKWVLVMFLPQ